MITVLIALLEIDKINGLHGDEYWNVVKLIIIISHIKFPVFRCRSLPLRQYSTIVWEKFDAKTFLLLV